MSLADFNPKSVSQKWYNIISQCFMDPAEDVVQNKRESDKNEHSAPTCRQTGTKEESSDDSTIISSQTSTLTRNQDSESFQPPLNINLEELVNCLRTTEDYDTEDTDDDEDEDEEAYEEGITAEFRPNDKLQVVLEHCSDEEEEVVEDKYSDKQTNTECAFYPEHAKQMKINAANGGGLPLDERGAIKRSQTFSPSAHVSKNHYICKLNRSDSDSAMPLYRRGNPFQRNAVERRSLRVRRQSGSTAALSTSRSHSHLPTTARTSLDLELDLQAQHTRLDMLNSELDRLRQLKERLEKAKEQGDTELAVWLLEDQQFQNLMAQAESCRNAKTAEEKKVEKMLKKVSKEIYKLRKSKAGKGKPDLISFK